MSRAALETEQATITFGTDPVQRWELVCPYRWCTLNGVLFGIRVRFHETIYQNLNGMCSKQEHDYCSIAQKSLSFIHIEFLLKRFITKSVRLAVRSHCPASVLQHCVQSATEADNSTFIVLLSTPPRVHCLRQRYGAFITNVQIAALCTIVFNGVCLGFPIRELVVLRNRR